MESIELTFLLIAIICVLLYTYLVWNFNYWKKRGVNGPKPKPLHGNTPSVITQKRNIIYALDDIYREYKGKERFVGIYSMRSPQLLIIDPKLIREILITNFKNFHVNEFATLIDKNLDTILSKNPFFLSGAEWKDKRAEVTPGLTTNRIKAVYGVMTDVCSKMTTYLENVTDIPPSDGIEAKQLAGMYTSEVVANCIYGIDTGGFTSGKSKILEFGQNIFKQSFFDILCFVIYNIVPAFREVYSRPFISEKTVIFFTDLMNQAINMRLSNKSDRIDFLNYLLQLKEKKNLSALEMSAHTLTFFLDGFETSSVLISNALHMLAKHKDVQNRLRDEINRVIAEDGELTFEKINEIPYLDQCINETLRLHTPFFFNNKICTQDCEITSMKDKKIKIEEGTVLCLPYHSIHQDEEYYPNPKLYNPDRFSEENGGLKKYMDMGVFLPFGDGPRKCLGMKFALCQSKAAITEIVRNWNLSVNPKTKLEYIVDAKQFLCVPQGGAWLDLKRIKN